MLLPLAAQASGGLFGSSYKSKHKLVAKL